MHDTDNEADDVFELLASSRRRLLLRFLLAHDGAAPLRRLSREIAVHEMDSTSPDVDNEEIQRVYISLYQTHVPALESHGIVEYDSNERVVSLDERPTEVLPFLEGAPTHGRQWALFLAGLAGILATTIVAHVAQVDPVSGTVVATVTVLSAVTLLVVVLARYFAIDVTRYPAQVLETLTS